MQTRELHEVHSRLGSSALEAIGNTPVVQLRKVVPQNSAELSSSWNISIPQGHIKTAWRIAGRRTLVFAADD